MSGKGGGVPNIPGDSPIVGNPITRWKEKTGLYPSNAMTWWLFKRPVVYGSTQAQRNYQEVFDVSQKDQLTFGNSAAPRGHYIYDAFSMDRSAVSGVSGLPVQSSSGARPSAVAFYAGRAFWAGVQSAKYNTQIFFSQILERDDQVGLCYQANDPTDEDTPDLLPSDGGVIVIPDMAQVVKLFVQGDSLFVFATNGVWQVSGSEGIGFRANDYSVQKITDTPALGAGSFVSVDGVPIWWNRSGIWTIARNQMGQPQLQSLSDGTIKTFMDDIPDECKRWAKGAYNYEKKLVQWVYSYDIPTTVPERYHYTHILNLNVLTGAFYPWKVEEGDDNVYIRGIFSMEGDQTVKTEEKVQVLDADVVVGTDTVIVDTIQHEAADSALKYVADVRKKVYG